MNLSGLDVVTAVLPLLKFLCLCIFGLLLSHPKIQLIPKATLKILSKLVFALFLPCLIFTNLGPSITLKNLVQWWFIPVNVLISTAIGCLLGLLVAFVCRPPPQYFRFTVIMTAFGNTGNLLLAVVASVCHSEYNPFGPDCYISGVAYVSFSQWVAVILVYTLVYHMMEPPLEFYEIVEEGTEIEEARPNVNDYSRPLLVEAEWPGMEDKETEHCKTPLIARLFNNNTSGSSVSQETVDLGSSVSQEIVDLGSSVSQEIVDLELEEGKIPESPSPKSIRCLAGAGAGPRNRIIRRIRIVAEGTPIRHILQPPTIASLLAIVIGLVPMFKAFVFDEDSVCSVLTDSLDILSEAMVPSVMLVLGGMLAEGPKQSDLGIRTTIGIVVARLLILPLLGIGIVSLADKLNFLIAGDKLFRFVLLMQYTTPSAILLGAIASLRAYAVKEASALLFWQHVCALFSFSLYMIVYFKILLS